MIILPTSGSLITTVSMIVNAMELYLIGTLLLITTIGVHSTVDSPGVIENKEQPKRQLHLVNSHQEVAALSQHDSRLNAGTGDNGGAFPQNIALPPPAKKQRLQTLTSNDDSYTKGKLRLMKRDASEGLNDDERPFPQNNDLPPPGQNNHLPPLTNGMSQTQAPSVDVTQKHTTDNVNVSSIMGMNTFCLLFCIVIGRFFPTFIST